MKIVSFADTHGIKEEIVNGKIKKITIPDGDILICAGDFCNTGSAEDTIRFNTWFSELPHKYKILVAGNHDRIFEYDKNLAKSFLNKKIIYLQDEATEIKKIKIYGSPWTLPFNNWAFNATEEKLAQIYKNIPQNIDILITHGLPFGILDTISATSKIHLGSKALLEATNKIKPKFHIGGHIHGSFGKIICKNKIVFANVSLLNEQYNIATGRPLVLEF